MKYSIDKQEKYAVFSLQEDFLNSLVAPLLKAELVIFYNEGVHNLILDLSNVKYVDSSGLSAILTGQRLWNGETGLFVITGVNHPSVKKLIEISRLSSILTISESMEEAIKIAEESEMEEVEEEEEEG
jgi:anti-sigma B factor antagonist